MVGLLMQILNAVTTSLHNSRSNHSSVHSQSSENLRLHARTCVKLNVKVRANNEGLSVTLHDLWQRLNLQVFNLANNTTVIDDELANGGDDILGVLVDITVLGDGTGNSNNFVAHG